MCVRYQRRSDKQKIAEAFALGNVDGLALELVPDYNVAPQTMQPVYPMGQGLRDAHATHDVLAIPPSLCYPPQKIQTFDDQREKRDPSL